MKTRKTQGVDDAKAQRLNIRVTPDAYERLLVHAIKARVSPGELVTSLIDRHLKDWRVQSVGVKANDRPDLAGQARDSEPMAA